LEKIEKASGVDSGGCEFLAFVAKVSANTLNTSFKVNRSFPPISTPGVPRSVFVRLSPNVKNE
jgi:hypothetical protein